MITQEYRVVVADDLLERSRSDQLTAFEQLTDGDTRLVLLCGQRQAARVHREAALARSILEARVAVVPLPGGPLAQFAMARIAERALIMADRPTAVIVSQLPALAAQLVDIGLVTSVSALDLPSVKLRHHLASYLPGSHLFAVQLTPTPVVAAASRARVPTVDFGETGIHLLVAGTRSIPVALAEELGALGPAVRVTADLDLPGFWRDEQATEVMVVPADPSAWVAQEVAIHAGHPCGWCDELLATTASSCVFCGHTPR